MVIGVLFGAFIWLLFELNKGIKRKDFTYNDFIRLNYIPFLTNLACGLVIIWAKEDITDYFVVTKFSSILLGLMGQGVFKKLVSVFDKNIETKFGINKKIK